MTEWITLLFKNQAKQAYETGNLKLLTASVNRLVQLQPSDNEAWAMLADAYYQTRQWYNALAWAKRWQHSQKNPESLFFMARLFSSVGLLHAALHSLDEIQQRFADFSAAETLRTPVIRAITSQQGLGNEVSLLKAEWQHALDHQDKELMLLVAEQLIRLNLHDDNIVRAAAMIHLTAQRYDEAETHFARLAHPLADDVLGRAEALLNTGGALQAEAILRATFDMDAALPASLCRLWFCVGAAKNQDSLCWQVLDNWRDEFLEDELLFDAFVQWVATSASLHNITQWLCEREASMASSVRYWFLRADAKAASIERADRERHAAELRALLLPALGQRHHQQMVHAKIGRTYVYEKNWPRAAFHFEQALTIDPNFSDALGELANATVMLGDLKKAEALYQRAVALTPGNAALWCNYGVYCGRKKAFGRSADCSREAIRLDPANPMAWNNLGASCLMLSWTNEARDAFEMALMLAPDLTMAQGNRLQTVAQYGHFDRAVELLREIEGGEPTVCSGALFYVNYHPHFSAEQVYAVYREAVDKCFPERFYFDYANEKRSDKKLNIAYVTGDFRGHAAYRFILPLVSHHDHSQFNIIAYSNVMVPDGFTHNLKTHFDAWHDISGMSAKQAAEKMRADGVDILIDLAGHTLDNRLDVMALKPVPLQATWMGYSYSTGLKQIDYFITDDEMLPPGFEHVIAEKPGRVGVPCVAYEPDQNLPASVGTPAKTNGYITFGSLTRAVRINERVINAWVNVLQRCPGSHLILNSATFNHRQKTDHFVRLFETAGIAAERLEIGFNSPPWLIYQQIDIMLDCFPHNSGTTLFEGVFMGVPFITRRDRVSMGRLGATIARSIGHAEWIADSDDEYIEKVLALAADVDALDALHQGLRAQMLASPLCDAAGFTRRVEAFYRKIWADYCDTANHPNGAEIAETLVN